MPQSSSVAMVKTASVYLNRGILENCFSKWGVILKNDNVDQSTWHCVETLSHGQQRLISLDAAVSGA